ncbi:hypothetical protein [Metamycoplasma alkalescens]|uniref:Uncharacterized protein n=2 Tax=Metamycoplasma alkalescens TaxID=45363 RepID=A0A318UIA4_9BACT|nr:hypothetical protein [Metamycoplasma alkalescens]PYF42249.1 hypothetical protein BCF88_1129 [Metamycoplasma alkalescens]
MKKIIENLSALLEIGVDELKNKLDIKDDTSSKELARKLGVYSIFETKEEHAEYINSKLANKEDLINSYSDKVNSNKELIEKQKIEIEKLNKSLENNLNYKTIISNFVKKEWENLGIKRSFEKEIFDYSSLDFSNLRKSLIDYANAEGLAFSKPSFSEFINEKEKENNESAINAIAVNGAVKK